MPPKTIPVYDIGDFQHLGTESDFYTNTLPEHFRQHNPFILVPHGHTFYVILLITRGNGVHEIDFHDYEIRPGSLFLLHPGQVHNWSVSDDIAGYTVFHRKEFFNLNFAHEKVEDFPFFSDCPNEPLLLLTPEQLSSIETPFQRMLEEYRNGALMRFQKIASLLNIVYIDLSRWYLPALPQGKKNQTQLVHMRRLEQLIDGRFREIKSPAKYAELMFMSEKNLNRVVRTSLNKTVLEVILDKVILEAKRMLIYTQLSVTEMAHQLGYEDTSYFNRLFKRTTGKTPLEFQREYRSKRVKIE